MSRDADPTSPAQEDFSLRAALPRTVGLSLAVNAIPDAYLLIDAPHCAFRRLSYVQGNHDFESTLSIFPGVPRVTNTELSPLKVVKCRDEEIVGHLTALANLPDAGVVLADAMAMAVVTATDYGRLCNRVAEATGRIVLPVPHRSLTSDWLTGYSDLMEALAGGLPLEARCAGQRRKVALVGYLWDRNEGDHRASLDELHRTFEALDLELVCVWFSGQPVSELRKVEEADWIVSLPYGRRAARLLSERLGCGLVVAELPFGLAATLRFVHALGAATGREEAALRFVERELEEVLPPLKWVVPFALTHRRLGFVGDPYLFPGIRDLAHLAGCTLPFAAFTCLPAHARASQRAASPQAQAGPHVPEDIRALMGEGVDAAASALVLSYPHARELGDTLDRLGRESALDVLVTNSFAFLTERMAVVELGFPSYHSHCLTPRPFLGMRGFLVLVETIVNASRQYEVRAARRARNGSSGP
jgi:hypothetical protein